MSGDGLIERLRAARATLVANSPQDRAVRDAIMELERLRDVQPYPVPAPDDGSIRVGGRRYQRFNGTWMVQPPMLRGYVPADPVACDWLDEIERLRAAGDVLAEWAAVDHSVEQCDDGCEYFAALRVWVEARRG